MDKKTFKTLVEMMEKNRLYKIIIKMRLEEKTFWLSKSFKEKNQKIKESKRQKEKKTMLVEKPCDLN